MAASDVRQQLPREGDRLDRFLLGELIGTGGMALVFRARDEKLNRDVAIKVLMPAAAAHKDGAERFRREALAVAAIRHPGIVEVYDFVPANGPTCAYLVEALIAGPTLQELLEKHGGRLLPELAAAVVADVAEALAAAHERGVVHRDIKPANIMLERAAQAARVVLTDFGVAHIGALTTMTATGAMVGSPAYMAPEQVRGKDIDPASDVWALGVLLYQVATGHLPFSGRDPISVIAAVAAGQFKRASQIEPRVGPELDRVMGACLKVNPSQRMRGAATMARELRAIVRDAGLPDGATIVRRLLDDADGFERELAPRLADQAVAKAATLIRGHQLARALAEIGRAGALCPGHPGAARLLKSIAARRKLAKVLLVVGGVATAVAGAFVIAQTRGLPSDSSLVSREAESPPAPATASVPTIAVAPATEARTPAVPAEPAEPAEPADRRVPRNSKASREIATVPRAAPASGAPAAAPASDVSAVAGTTATSALANPVPVSLAGDKPIVSSGRVRLYSSFGFCYPALDDARANDLTPIYLGVPAGEHRIFCAEKQDGPKQYVGTIMVKPGAEIERQILRGADGKPTLSRVR